MTPWRVAHAVVTGSEHLRHGLGCQDAALLEVTPDALFVAVSDGAGSASHAAEGAAAATRAALAYLQSTPTPTGPDLIAAARLALEAEAARLAQPLRALACTLLVARVGPDEAFFAQVGDGAIVYRAASDTPLTLAFPPDKGEHANETRFITSSAAAAHVQSATVAAPTALALLTDGLERQALDLAQHTPFAPFFDPLLGAVATLAPTPEASAELSAELADFLTSPRVAEATGDDLTLVLCCR